MRPTATYSPEDNKLRIYPVTRLSETEFADIKAAGFRWAPKQELFFTSWDPRAEDAAIALAGEIEDEDKSLVERAEERAERFEEYSANRAAEAEQAHAAVERLAGMIPLGQPILVGHHSEKRARKDAERIQNGMQKAVSAFETSEYWSRRAKGALHAAKYKELPAVRARRIKGLEADLRRVERSMHDTEFAIRFWSGQAKSTKQGVIEISEANKEALEHYTGSDSRLSPNVATHPRGYSLSAWHLLRADVPEDYPKMTVEQIRDIALEQARNYQKSCARWIAHYKGRLEYERAMQEESGGMAADKIKPEVGGACRCWASPTGGWSLIKKVNKVSVTVLDQANYGGRMFSRTMPFDKLPDLMSRAQVEEARKAGRVTREDERGFYLLDGAPASKASEPEPADPIKTKVEALKASLEAGVQTVVANQLFPTPPSLAARLIAEADIQPGHAVLEPSAGTGNLLAALPQQVRVLAMEINGSLVDSLRSQFEAERAQEDFCVLGGDFLAAQPEPEPQGIGRFDRVVMNPPFERGADLKHIKHAFGFLKPGGRLVALCAQRDATREWVETLGGVFEPLPDGSFDEQGTGVRTALVTVDANAYA